MLSVPIHQRHSNIAHFVPLSVQVSHPILVTFPLQVSIAFNSCLADASASLQFALERWR